MKLINRTSKKLNALSLIAVFILTVVGMLLATIDKALKELILSILRSK